jgi:hypothetical protein
MKPKETTWDGKENQPGWTAVPKCEVSVAPDYRFISAWGKGNELRIHVEPIFHLEFCPGCGQKLTPVYRAMEVFESYSIQAGISARVIQRRCAD